MKLLFKKIILNLRENWITYGFETLVVVVGILGAFELENWKEARQDRVREQEYLNRIENDLKSDTIYYGRRITECQKYIDAIYKLVHDMYKTQKTLKEYQDLLSLDYFSTEHLTIQNFTFLEITSSGNLSLINNQVLTAELIAYYNKAEIRGKHIKEINEWSVEMLLKYFDIVPSVKNSDWGKTHLFDDPEMFKYEDWSYINDPSSKEFKAVEGVREAYHTKFTFMIPWFEELKEHSKNILTMLKEEKH